MFEISDCEKNGYILGIVPSFVLEQYPLTDSGAETIIIVGRVLKHGTGQTVSIIERLISTGYRAYRINCENKEYIAVAGGVGYYLNGEKIRYPDGKEIQNIEIILTNWIPKSYTVPVSKS